MSVADKLVVDGLYDDWRIVWYIEEEGELGLILGADVRSPGEQKKMMADDPFSKKNKETENTDHVLYTQAALENLKGVDIDEEGFVFESKSHAVNSIRVIREAARARIANRPLPEWAITALANGWKMPKGWVP